MSHFTVLVVTDTANEEEICKALQPFHEYECTGIDDQYVVHVDITDEAKSAYETATLVLVVQRPDGTKFYAFEEGNYCAELQQFLVEGDLGRKNLVLPEGWSELRGEPAHDHKTLVEWAMEYYGITDKIEAGDDTPGGAFVRVDQEGNLIQVCQYTNPKAKWDWWQIGGRWTGHLKMKDGTVGKAGKPGLMTDECPIGYADQARKGDIDFDGKMDEAAAEAAAEYDKAMSVISGRYFKTWPQLRDAHKNIDEARSAYHGQPAVIDLKSAFGAWVDVDKFATTREAFIQYARSGSISTFAVLKDGQWHERGSMGWFAVVSDEKVDWESDFLNLLNSIPDDKYLTVVDCHI